jgi:uncharacterized protein YciI
MLLRTLARSSLQPTRTLQRSFSAAVAADKKQFVVIVHDHKDPDALHRRLAVRPTHLVAAKQLKRDGVIHLGGAILTDHTESGKMCGSALIINADSAEQVTKIIESDPYFQDRVWDKYTIFPFRQANIDP